jgi:SpoIID/LytB domain protein
VRDEVAKMFGERPSAIGTISELSILRRTESGRVGTLAIRGPESELVLDRLDIRFALRDGEGRILGSTDFDLQAQSDGGVRIEGRGFGHGAGMCQWGAIARSRAGQTMEEILATYYPGAALTRVY